MKEDARYLYRALGPFISISETVVEGIVYKNRTLNWSNYQDHFGDM